ncbi:MAG: hypothetical protein DWH86_00965 [Planctomycetota bacterium]|nr:MAG: hypothetical protein DWH86_00965 [Planctomycetota bacterium]
MTSCVAIFLCPGTFYRVALLGACLLTSCSLPDAASDNKAVPGDTFPPDVVLKGSNANAAIAGMRQPTAGYQARPLVPAADHVRWTDVPMAARNVASKQFVGIQSFEFGADRFVAVTLAADGQTGTVTVERVSSGDFTTVVQLGVFPETHRDELFAKAFEAEMLRLGAIPRPQ